MFHPAQFMFTSDLACLYGEGTLEAYGRLAQIAVAEGEKAAAFKKYMGILSNLGFPPYITGAAEVPFDIISDYFRGTMGMFADRLNCPETVLEACEMLVDKQLQAFNLFMKYNQFCPSRIISNAEFDSGGVDFYTLRRRIEAALINRSIAKTCIHRTKRRCDGSFSAVPR